MLLAGEIMIGGSGAAFDSCSAIRGVETAGSFFAELDESVVRLTVHSEPFRCADQLALRASFSVSTLDDAALRARNSDADAG